jgi:phosphoglycerate dehydrogenase-like enzyme
MRNFKLTFVGAGSTIFVKNLVGDCMLRYPDVAFEVALFDIDEQRLEVSRIMLEYIAKKYQSKAKVVAYRNRKEAFKDADFIVLTLPLTKESRYLINEDILSAMKRDAVIINISRGAVVNTEHLINALSENAIGGAVLDVFEEEPLGEDSPLWDMENLIVTPHNSFVGDGNSGRLYKVIMENLGK